MNRKEYIKTQLFLVLALVIAACKKRIIEVTPAPAIKKVLQIKSVLPEVAVASELLKIEWESENIEKINIYYKLNQDNWKTEGTNLLASLNYFELKMPDTFLKNDLLSVKISSEGIESIKENIPTNNVFIINTSTYSELKTINGIEKVNIPLGDVFVKRISANEIKSFIAVCTHLSCGILYSKNDNVFNCPCHGAKFSTDGKVLNGPANEPLNEYECQQVSPEVFRLLY
ncbi:MAG: Rieske 2Fe-2S domain-containing protein [Bacteroidetes bacterium]|nr:Rieske 2Fe-2S domain-containing protein [Bacteroidota bacterium]